VRAALADPNRNVPARDNHWQYLTTAFTAHDSGAGVRLVTIKPDGRHHQRVFLFGGDNGANGPEQLADGTDVGSVAETIDFSAPSPTWQRMDNLAVPASQNNAVALPDGKILVVGGRNSFDYQMYDPATGKRTDLISSPVPRHDHSTMLVMPDATVWVMGGNRVQLACPPTGSCGQALRDISVPVLEVYRPPYLFARGPRPVITKAPKQIHYGQKFKLDVGGRCGRIAAVTMLRTGPITHNWAWGNHYVSVPFTHGRNGKLHVDAPPLPGLAVGGDYMLFVVSDKGIPSRGVHVRLGSGQRGHRWSADDED
jgi:hypothetical protein